MTVVGVHVRVLLVVEIVEDARGCPQLRVLAVFARVHHHRGLDAEHVLAQRLRFRPLAEEAPGLVTIDFAHAFDPTCRDAGRPHEAAEPRLRTTPTIRRASSAPSRLRCGWGGGCCAHSSRGCRTGRPWRSRAAANGSTSPRALPRATRGARRRPWDVA